VMAAAPRMASTGFLIEDSTTGRVRRGPFGRPLATYQLTRSDERRIATGFAWCAEALLAAGARRVLVAAPGRPWARTTGHIARIREDGVPVEALKLSAYHPVGTHRAAGSVDLGPSDPWGAVRGTEGLWVADASALPSCTGVNPQITIMAFGVRTARRVLALAGASGGAT
jgi:choline dehydrogenase-like flavoprotein